MTTTRLSSRELNQNIGRAKRASEAGPVVITDRGKPAHVLLSYEDYQRLAGHRQTLAEALAMPAAADVTFDPPRAEIGLRVPDFC